MKSKSNMTVSKLQSESVKELQYTFPLGKASRKQMEQFLSDQIQKAYSKGREEVLKELRVRIDTWGGFEDDGGNLAHYDEEILEWLQSLPWV